MERLRFGQPRRLRLVIGAFVHYRRNQRHLAQDGFRVVGDDARSCGVHARASGNQPRCGVAVVDHDRDFVLADIPKPDRVSNDRRRLRDHIEHVPIGRSREKARCCHRNSWGLSVWRGVVYIQSVFDIFRGDDRIDPVADLFADCVTPAQRNLRDLLCGKWIYRPELHEFLRQFGFAEHLRSVVAQR